MSIKILNDSNATNSALDSVEKNDGILVVNYFATWCGACKMLAPILEKFSSDNEIEVIKLDADADKTNEQKFAVKYLIEALPTTLFFKKGSDVPVEKIVGFVPQEILEKAYQKAKSN